jgi:hypothetical protein
MYIVLGLGLLSEVFVLMEMRHDLCHGCPSGMLLVESPPRSLLIMTQRV